MVLMKLGGFKAGLATLAIGGEVVEHDGGELAVGKLGLELEDVFAGLRQY